MRTSALAVAFAAAAFAQRTVPVENEHVRVLDVTAAPHQKTRLHEHAMNRVMVYLHPGSQRIEYPGKPSVDIRWKAGEPLWSPAAGMHTAEIDSVQPVRIIEIELKEIELKKSVGPAPVFPALDPIKIDPKHYRVEFENTQVRVTRVKIGPGETAPLHEHKLNRVVVFLTSQHFRIASADGTNETSRHNAGDVIWSGPAKHTEQNIGEELFEAIVVELKN